MAIRPVAYDREPGRCVTLQVQIMPGIGNDHQLQLRPWSTDRRDQVAGTCALAVTVIDSRLSPCLRTGRWGTKVDIILPDAREDGHVDALHECGGVNNCTGIFAYWGDILHRFLECHNIRVRIRGVQGDDREGARERRFIVRRQVAMGEPGVARHQTEQATEHRRSGNIGVEETGEDHAIYIRIPVGLDDGDRRPYGVAEHSRSGGKASL